MSKYFIIFQGIILFFLKSIREMIPISQMLFTYLMIIQSIQTFTFISTWTSEICWLLSFDNIHHKCAFCLVIQGNVIHFLLCKHKFLKSRLSILFKLLRRGETTARLPVLTPLAGSFMFSNKPILLISVITIIDI